MSGAGSPDFFYREAQRLGYVARSAFKLLQMQEKYKLIKPGSSVLDLGCAPGAWLQNKGFSVILSDMCPVVSGITTRDAALSVELGMRALNLAIGEVSLMQAYDNVEEKAQQHDGYGNVLEHGGILLPGGHLVVKLLESEDIKEFSQICKPLFKKASWLRPKATRSCSREIYLICQGFYGPKATEV